MDTSSSPAGRAPDFFCIGAQKAGTSWLYYNLSKHPGVWLTPIKELHYFSQLYLERQAGWKQRHRAARAGEQLEHLRRAPPTPANADLARLLELIAAPDVDDGWYRSIFGRAPAGAVCGDFTPEYSILPAHGIEHVQRLAPNARIILLVRDPIERAWSQIRMLSRSQPQVHPLKLAMREEVANRSDYEAILTNWRRCFDGSRILVRSLDAIAAEPATVLADVCRFLDLSFDAAWFEHLNVPLNLGVPSEIPDAVRAFLLRTMEGIYIRLVEELPVEGALWRARHYGKESRGAEPAPSRPAPLSERRRSPSQGTQRLTVLLSHERSGSHLLGDFVSSLRGVRRIDEVGNPRALRPSRSLLSIHRFRAEAIEDDPGLLLDPTSERHDGFLGAYFERLLAARSPFNTVVDIKYSHVHLFEGTWWPIFERPYLLTYCERESINVLHLHRENVVEAAASALIAEARQVWHSWERNAAATADRTYRLDVSEVVRRAKLLSLQAAWFKGWIGEPCLDVTYEQLAGELGRRGALDERLAAFLGGELAAPFVPRHQKVTRPLSEVVENYEELHRACSTEGLGDFLHRRAGASPTLT
jgi:hypothetical protein